MQQAAETTETNSVRAGVAVTQRDRQRVALRDLVALATESATTEALIEKTYASAQEEAAKDAKKGEWEAEERQRQWSEQAQRKYDERIAHLTTQYDAEKAALSATDTKARQRTEHEFKTADRDVREKYQQSAWLAESVFEGTQKQANEEHRKVREEVEADNAFLDEQETKMRELLDRYGMTNLVATGEGPAAAEPEDASVAYLAARQRVEKGLAKLRGLFAPRLFVGFGPYVLVLALCGGAAAVAQVMSGSARPEFGLMGRAAGITLGSLVVLGVLLRLLARSQVRKTHAALRRQLDEARGLAKLKLDRATKIQQDAINAAAAKRDAETKAVKDRLAPILEQAKRRREQGLQAAQIEHSRQLPLIESRRERLRTEAEESLKRHRVEIGQRFEKEVAEVRGRHQQRLAEAKKKYEEARAALERRLREGLHTIGVGTSHEREDKHVLPRQTGGAQPRMSAPPRENEGKGLAGVGAAPFWDDPYWDSYIPPKQFPAGVPFGRLWVDLQKIADAVALPNGGQRQLQLPGAFSVPVALEFPHPASLIVQADRSGREPGLAVLRMVMARLLTSLPAGRVRFTLIDPVGLGQNFAGFMHLADHDEALVGGRIWTEREHIEQRLADLTEHMETVIQKYLRNEFETIDEYNAQAGELAEPYRFLVIADFPTGFEGEALARLSAIVNSGARCGIHTLILRDTRQPLPQGIHLEELELRGVNLVWDGAEHRFTWKDDIFGQFPLTLDASPGDEFLTRILDVVGRHAKDANRVEVPFDTIAPPVEKLWSMSSAEELRVPVGRMGATRLQQLKLGRGVAQHVLIAGKTGSGKSTLLHALVTNLAMWYSPDEVEFYLVDFKKGVEFKTYATHELPHARAIAVESDREFGLSVLQRLDAELTRRGDLFRRLGIQDLPAYRELATDKNKGLPPLPRTLFIIDEFQEFFSEDDKLAQGAGLLLDRLVRQGRAFGVHVLLGSQTIGGTSGLARSTIGQMAVRVALQTSEADSQLILGDGNSAARLLSRPGEAIYNDQGGLVEANSPFQIAWLPDEKREVYLERVRDRSPNNAHAAAIVFEGNAPADLKKNVRLAALLDQSNWPQARAPVAFIGEPVAIKDPTAVPFKRQAGSNVLIVGQQEESALALVCTMLISLAAQQSPGQALFYVMDGTPADSGLAGKLRDVYTSLPHEVKGIEYRGVEEAIGMLAAEVARRQTSEDPAAPSIYVIIYGLQRYRALRKSEESFGFGMSDEEKKPQPDKQLADILREGPGVGVHVIAWCDTPASVERTFDRTVMREFDHRILFQMSANDSSNLIDSPQANKLGFHRALAYSEEQGVLEKFRPYAIPTAEFLAGVRERLAARA